MALLSRGGRSLVLIVALASIALVAVLLVRPFDQEEQKAAQPHLLELTFTLDIRGRDAVTFDPAVEFEDELGGATIALVRITNSPDSGTATVSSDGEITYQPPDTDIEADQFSFELLDEEGDVIASVDALVAIEHIHDVIASERSIDFDEVCVWCSASTRMEVAADADSIELEAVSLGGDDADQFEISHHCSEAGVPSCDVEIIFTPVRPGPASASIEVVHSGDGPALVIPVTGSGACERPDNDRTEILDEVIGFGREAIGGAEGCLVRVTSLDDDGPGTLREAAERRGPAWIVFDVSGEIELDAYVDLTADKTVDGRGSSIELTGAGLAAVDTPNLIIANLKISNTREDGIHLRGTRTQHVWVTQLTIGNIADGYIDVTQGATGITISRSRFLESPDWPQEKCILIGAADPGDPDERSRVTLHHNLFDGLEQRSPLLRAGRVHSFNNFFDGWGIYGSGVSANGHLLSERNIYWARGSGDHPDRAFTPWDEAVHNDGDSANIRSVNDRFVNGASGTESNRDKVFQPDYGYSADEANDELRDGITERAGWQGG